MNRMETSVATFIVATVLCLCVPLIASDIVADDTGEVIGTSYWSHSPSGDYSMEVRYHDDGNMWIAVMDPITDDHISEIQRAVSITVFDSDGYEQKRLYPLMIMGEQWVNFGIPILPDGDYLVKIDNSSEVTIVESRLWIGVRNTITIQDPGDSTKTSFEVPVGSIITISGTTMIVSFVSGDTSYPLKEVTASIPQGSFFSGWYVNGELLTDGSTVSISEDMSVTAGYDRWVRPSPTPDPEPTPTEIEDTFDDGGSILTKYEVDDSGNSILINPITIKPGDTNKITSEQCEVARGYIDRIVKNEMDPHVIILTDEGSVGVPSDLLEAIIEGDGSLTVIEDEVTLFFDSNVLDEIGHVDDIEFIVTSVTVAESADMGVDVSSIGDDATVYDVYMIRNGERITKALSSPIQVSIEYPLESWQSEDLLHVYYVDIVPFEEFDITYSDGAIHFSVYHFSHYAIVYDDAVVIKDINWLWSILVMLVLFSIVIIRMDRKESK